MCMQIPIIHRLGVIALFAALASAPMLAGAQSTDQDHPTKKEKKKKKKKKKKGPIDTLDTYTECSKSNPLPMTLDIAAQTLYIVNAAGEPISPNLLGGTLGHEFTRAKDLKLLFDPAPGTRGIEGEAQIYVHGQLVDTRKLKPQADGSGAELYVSWQDGLHVEISLGADIAATIGAVPQANGKQHPLPKLVLEPTDECPPEPPPP